MRPRFYLSIDKGSRRPRNGHRVFNVLLIVVRTSYK
jgi:hypothetical protein